MDSETTFDEAAAVIEPQAADENGAQATEADEADEAAAVGDGE